MRTTLKYNLYHKPVLLKEVTQFWHTKWGGRYIDGTLGLGGHTKSLLQVDSNLQCLGIDLDENALTLAKNELQSFTDRVLLMSGRYNELPQIMKKIGWEKADGLLLDLGVSSLQLDDSTRGFSFRKQAPLDMRMDLSQKLTALSLIKDSSESELARLILKYGEEKKARLIAHLLKKAVHDFPQLDTITCAQIIKNSLHAPLSFKKQIHPATKTFQALRIVVNQELENLEQFLKIAPELLNKGGHLLFISFHSLEDRMIKEKAIYWQKECVCPPGFPKCVCGKKQVFRLLNKKPIVATESEINKNNRSRSAKLRVLEKC